MNVSETGRMKPWSVCQKCCRAMTKGHPNLFIDRRGKRHCLFCWNAGLERKALQARFKRSETPSLKLAPPPPPIDHTQCVPPDHLCSECLEIWNNVPKRKAAR
jgi:hypothetical protein